MISAFFLNSLIYGVFVPGMLIATLPILPWSRYSRRKTILLFSVGVVFFCASCALIETVFSVSIPDLLLLFLCFLIYIASFRLPIRRLAYLFLTTTAYLSFGTLLHSHVAAHTDLRIGVVSVPGLAAQYALSFVILLFTVLLRHRIEWVFRNFNLDHFWRIVWLVPFAVTLVNIYNIDPAVLSVTTQQADSMSKLLNYSCVFFLFTAFQLLLYLYTQEMVRLSEKDQEDTLARLESRHYENIQKAYLKESRQRHDFKHVMLTVSELLKEQNYEELERFTNTYFGENAPADTPHVFCENLAVNALLNYYYGRAVQEKIRTSFRVTVPSSLPVSDTDLSVIFGNLLDNAIRASLEIPEKKRYIHLRADNDTPGQFYITMVNGFSGKVKKSEAGYLSTWNGHGIGLSSINLTAEKYSGQTKFRAQGTEFRSNIMLLTSSN